MKHFRHVSLLTLVDDRELNFILCPSCYRVLMNLISDLEGFEVISDDSLIEEHYSCDLCLNL